MTVAMATGMTITRRNSGSKIPPLRRAIQRQTISETFPAREEPRMPPMKGATYSSPMDNEDMSYGLTLVTIAWGSAVPSLEDLCDDFGKDDKPYHAQGVQ